MKINKRSSTVESLLMMKRKFVEIEQDMEMAKELGRVGDQWNFRTDYRLNG